MGVGFDVRSSRVESAEVHFRVMGSTRAERKWGHGRAWRGSNVRIRAYSLSIGGS